VSEDALVGQQLDGAYRIHRRIAAGSTGVVYEAEQLQRPRARVAIKVLLPGQPGAHDSPRARLRSEAEDAAALDHPQIVKIQRILRPEEGQPCVIMELLEGETLGALLDRAGWLSLQELDRLVVQTGAALQAAHDRGIVHGDLKPGNIFLVATPDQSLQVKLLEFGICRVAAGSADPADDVRALGAVCYHCLTGRPALDPRDRDGPGEPTPVQELREGLSGELQRVLARAMARDPNQRHATVQQLSDELQRALQGCVEDQRTASAAGAVPRTAGRAVTTEPTAVVAPRPEPPEEPQEEALVTGEIEAARQALEQNAGAEPPGSKVELELPEEVDSPLTLSGIQDPTVRLKFEGDEDDTPVMSEAESNFKVPVLNREDPSQKITVVPSGETTRRSRMGHRREPTREMPLGPRGDAAREARRETPEEGSPPVQAPGADRRPSEPMLTVQVPQMAAPGPRRGWLLLLGLVGLALAIGTVVLLLLR
jgi:serine/threonine-protein kinase